MNAALPQRTRGRPTAASNACYAQQIKEFCERIVKIRSRLDFEVGTRGWCYLLEGEGVITKGEFDEAERLITRCRKTGDLPLDICAEDSKRAANGIEDIDENDVGEEVDSIIRRISFAHEWYTPFSFWDDLDVYVEMAVEKSDLKSLFQLVTNEFHIVLQNIGGWADLNVRAHMMRRFKEWEAKGKQCVLLYCGDHDPGGLHISDFLRANFEELEKAVSWSLRDLVIDRFGLDYGFIEANGLTWIDNLETSSGGSLADLKHPDHFKPYVRNYLKQYGARKVEANALVARPDEGRELCRQTILKYIPESAVRDYEVRLGEIREELRQAIAARISAP
jgi:hypothetical protein